jgi:flavin prenyltransferase
VRKTVTWQDISLIKIQSTAVSESETRTPRRLVVGISGATGIIYGVQLLRRLREAEIESHLVISKAGETTRHLETSVTTEQLRALATVYYRASDIAAAISSGSFKTMGMIIAPCSMRTLAEIATGMSSTLLTRAADVVLKERRRLVMLTRETPLHAAHLRNMLAVTEMGGIIMPPVPAFYTNPKSIEEIVDQTVCRALDLFGIEMPDAKRWTGPEVPINGCPD